MKNKKIVIIINGRGGVGKDALCEIAQRHFDMINVSTITPIKTLATAGGWDGTKDEKGRMLLVKLKEIFTEFNNLPFLYVFNEYKRFLESSEQIMFVHIRELSNIDFFKQNVPCKTLLVKRNGSQIWNNASDDNAENYDYDYVFENNKPLEESGKDFIKLLKRILSDA